MGHAEQRMYVYGWLTQTDPPVCRLLVAVVVAVVAAAALAAAGLAGLAALAATVPKIVCGAKISFLAVFGYSFFTCRRRTSSGRARIWEGKEKKSSLSFIFCLAFFSVTMGHLLIRFFVLYVHSIQAL